ncbi:MAG: SpoIIE family protein phosphatase [Leptospiraceae bacterium]|nr:SpoIIE family protein phosphatase [Leptospiraceae bacterium]
MKLYLISLLVFSFSLFSEPVEVSDLKNETLNILPFLENNYNLVNEQDLLKVIHSDEKNWEISRSPVAYVYPGGGTHLWTRFSLKNSGSTEVPIFISIKEFALDKIICYVVHENENMERFQGGSSLPLKYKPIHMIDSLFPVHLSPNESIKIYLDIQSDLIAFTQIEIFSISSLLDYFLKNYVLTGIFYGIIIFMSIFSFSIFYYLRDYSYLYYFGVMFFDGIYQLSQSSLTTYFVYPENPEINTSIWYFAFVMSLFFATLFARDFLNLKFYHTKLHRTLGIMSLVIFLFLPLPSLINENIMYIALTVGFLYILGFYISSFYVYRKGFQPAKYFILGWSFLLLGKIFSIIPIENYYYSEYSSALGSSLQMLFVALAILSKMNRLQIEKDEMSNEITGIKKELNLAEKMQLSLLPEGVPKLKGCDLAAYYLPMKQIGGDYYDFYVKDPQSFTCFVADVSGHGPAAALVASMLKVAFKASHSYYHRPEAALRKMNTSLLGNLGKKFVTAVYAHFSLRSNILTYCSAGHPAIMVHKRNEDKVIYLECKGQFIGWFENIKLKEHQYKFASGDRIIIYTDGVIEAFNEKHEMFDYDNFEIAVKSNASMNAEGLNYFIAYRVKEWIGFAKEFDDDITILVIDIP